MPTKKEEMKKVEDKVGAKAIAVFNKGGEYIRTYSIGMHGKDFLKLATMYSEKIGGKMRKAG